MAAGRWLVWAIVLVLCIAISAEALRRSHAGANLRRARMARQGYRVRANTAAPREALVQTKSKVKHRVASRNEPPAEDAPGGGAEAATGAEGDGATGAESGGAEDASTGEAAEGGQGDTLPTDLCFPLIKSDRKEDENMDRFFGQVRGEEAPYKCHRALDIFTQENTPGRVIAVTDGTVMQTGYFYGCKGGKSLKWDNALAGQTDWSSVELHDLPAEDGKKCEFDSHFILVRHPKIKLDLLYGEAGQVMVKAGEEVTRGQLLGLYTVCGMLHLEAYESVEGETQRMSQLTWESPTDQPCTAESAPTPLKDPRPLIHHILALGTVPGCHEDGTEIALPPYVEQATKCEGAAETPEQAAEGGKEGAATGAGESNGGEGEAGKDNANNPGGGEVGEPANAGEPADPVDGGAPQ